MSVNTRHRGGWLALAGAAILAAWTIYQADDAPATVCTLVFDGGQRIEALPAAITDPQRRKGLSGRAAAAPGMLFSWGDSAERAFWMRDTHMALTVAFLAGDGRVFHLADMKPDTALLHRSEKPATDAIELPQGDFQGRGIREGSRLVSRACRAR
ncbi:conserved exported protein of unknown function (plasmid) [Ralstonia solanacearum CMR15]|nr:conserved exported protein of unknown function [Ralstonia solanacearum CMR15]